MMLGEKELKQVRDYVIRILPELLREEPEIATTIEGMLAQIFPRRDEFARLLDELALLREEQAQRFIRMQEEMDQRFIQQSEERAQRLIQLREEMGERLSLLREEMNQRLEQVDRRFEQVDQRFEQVDQRFEQVDQRFEQVDQRFEQMNRTMLETRRDVAGLQHGQEMLLKQMEGQEAWLRLAIGDLRRENGRTLEDMFALALRHGLKNPDIAPEKIRLRQKLVDADGLVFDRGYATEADLITENDSLTVFEVKATARQGDVDMLAWKVQLVTAQNPDKQVRGVFITLAPSEDVRQRCAEHGLQLVS